ncbi:hypothetical protein CYY_003977 [Polysphondylium violaceum]|uniref:Uncharacterized protein n=1 Tax=Polysphondylium violaceum TaxID=133409 RepID=A0A8J4UZP0_9MYCE|nr:hypothetical protein CYY_003977 [Polysphondylium violaceum]
MILISMVVSVFYSIFVVLLSVISLHSLELFIGNLPEYFKNAGFPMPEAVKIFLASMSSFKGFNLTHILLFSIVLSVLALKRELCGSSCGASSAGAASSGKKKN